MACNKDRARRLTKEVAYVPSLDRICVITAWLGHHVIVDLGFAEQRLTATVPVEGLVVFKRQGPDQTLIDLMARPESGAAADR